MPGSRLSFPGSQGSVSSKRSGYRTVGKESHVDESLFGSKSPVKSGSAKTLATPNRKASSISPKRGGAKGAKPPAPEMVLLHREDLQRMRKPADVLTAEEIAQLRKDGERRIEEQQAVSKARKEHMLKMEEDSRNKGMQTETERLQARANQHTRNRAEGLLDEQRDEVKHMNQMVLYSKCVTIRDAQIEEKKHMLEEEEAEERALDVAMEIDRIRALEAYEQRERQRAADRRRGAEILDEQLAERERERIKQEELRQLERDQMTREIERLKADEHAAALEKRKAAEQLMLEVQRSNGEQVKRKALIKTAELEEDALITEYLRQRDLREQAQQEEKVRAAKEKELETARLRAKQERAADRQAEIDELRARRYQEAYERDWRQKEKQARERAAAVNSDLAEAREAQRAATVLAQAEMARVEAEEFQRVLEENKRIEEAKLQQERMSLELRKRHKEELRAQIAANQERHKREHAEYLLEGEKTRSKLEEEKGLIEAIRQRKLHEMEVQGVPAKYRAELARKKLSNW